MRNDKRSEKKGGRFKRLSRVLFLGAGLIGGIFTHMNAAEAAPVEGDILKYATIPKSDEIVSSKYAVIAQFKPGKSKRILSGADKYLKTSAKDRDLIVDAPDSLKGKIKVRYTDIATFNGRTLDFEIVVSDWKRAGFPSGDHMYFYGDHIGFHQSGFDYVSLKGTYVYADTKKPATDLPGSYMTINDLDANQFVSFDPEMMKNIDKIYAYPDTRVSYWKTGTKVNIGARFWEAIDSDDKQGFVTLLVSGHEFNFDWSKDWSRPSSANNYYNLSKPIDWYNEYATQYFGYVAEKPVKTEVLTPSKKIIDDGEQVDENAVTAPDNYTYNVYHTVPAEYPDFFYKSYVMQDTIHKALEIESTRIYDGQDRDVSSKFTITTTSNNVKAVAKAAALDDKAFYGEDYRLEMKVKINDSEKLLEYSNGTNKFTIPNKGSVTVDGKSKSTNEVKTVVTLPKTEIGLKKIQVYTDKADKGLPTFVDLDSKFVYDSSKNKTFDLVLYQKTGSTEKKVATKSVKMSDSDKSVQFTVPKANLSVDKMNMYRAAIENYDKDFISVDDKVKDIDTEGYTAKEGTLTETSDTDKKGEAVFKGVTMTEREIGKSIKRNYETLTVTYTPKRSLKSGYGYELDGSIRYENPIMAENAKYVTFNRSTNAGMTLDKALVDPSLSFYDKTKTRMVAPLMSSQSGTNNATISTYSYKAPRVYLEQKTGLTYTQQQVDAKEPKGKVIDAGQKFYVPVWIEGLGARKASLTSEKPLGAHQMNVNTTGVIDVTAYMFNHEGSETPDDDELLVHPTPQGTDLFK